MIVDRLVPGLERLVKRVVGAERDGRLAKLSKIVVVTVSSHRSRTPYKLQNGEFGARNPFPRLLCAVLIKLLSTDGCHAAPQPASGAVQ